MPFWSKENKTPQQPASPERDQPELYTDWVEPELFDFFRGSFPDEGMVILTRPFREWSRLDSGQFWQHLPNKTQRHETLRQRAQLVKSGTVDLEQLIAIQDFYFDEVEKNAQLAKQQLAAQDGDYYEAIRQLVNEYLQQQMWNFWVFEKFTLLDPVKRIYAEMFNALFDPSGGLRSAGVSPKTSFTGIDSVSSESIKDVITRYFAARITQGMYQAIADELGHTPRARSYAKIDAEFRPKEISQEDQKFIDGSPVIWPKNI